MAWHGMAWHCTFWTGAYPRWIQNLFGSSLSHFCLGCCVWFWTFRFLSWFVWPPSRKTLFRRAETFTSTMTKKTDSGFVLSILYVSNKFVYQTSGKKGGAFFIFYYIYIFSFPLFVVGVIFPNLAIVANSILITDTEVSCSILLLLDQVSRSYIPLWTSPLTSYMDFRTSYWFGGDWW